MEFPRFSEFCALNLFNISKSVYNVYIYNIYIYILYIYILYIYILYIYIHKTSQNYKASPPWTLRNTFPFLNHLYWHSPPYVILKMVGRFEPMPFPRLNSLEVISDPARCDEMRRDATPGSSCLHGTEDRMVHEMRRQLSVVPI